jgi:probable HAF family extracellular repeat protein
MKTRSSFFTSRFVFIVIVFGFQTLAYGYEVETHKEISSQAASKSILTKYDFNNFGLTSSSDGLTAEGLKCDSNSSSTKTALDWILEGSVCEDDTFTESFARYKNHFYDPQHDGKGYGGFLWKDSGILRGAPAPDWIIDAGPADGQLYSFSQGRQYFYKALTKSTDAERKANLARMFRTLGDVMHIMQDMAQPQHTRNDSHGMPKSNYEVYTDQKRANGTLPYSGETAPPFATAREYFTSLAQFSNNNFVSAGTNFDVATNYGYNLPAPGAATDVPIHTLPDISPEVLAECSASKPCVMTFYSTNQTVSNPRASTQSILDQYLKLRKVSYTDPVTSNEYFKNRIFSLNKYTFDSAHPFLIPRATAYSAGILDYFFRGSINMVADPNNPGKYTIKNLGAEDMSGKFELYYDAVDGNRYPVPGAAWSNLTVSANSQANNLSFASPVNPAPQTSGEYTLVFSGTLGAEQAGNSSFGVANSSIGAIVAKKVDLAVVVGVSDITGDGARHAFSFSNGVMTDLGTLGGTYSCAKGRNTAGTIVGHSYAGDGAYHAFSYSGGVMSDLGTLGGAQASATGINTAGTIVGASSITGDGTWHAFSYSNGVMTDLGTLGGSQANATGINTAGTIVGTSYTTGNGAFHAFSYSGGVMTDLGALGGGLSEATGINTAGTIVGTSTTGDGAWHAFSYSGGVMTDLGTLGGSQANATGINTAGTIVGKSSIFGNGAYHAFSYSNGVMTDLGTLGGTNSIAEGINTAGTIVGESQITGDSAWHAFSFSNGVMTDLGTLGGTDSSAYGIN